MKRPFPFSTIMLLAVLSCVACQKTQSETHEFHSFIQKYSMAKGIAIKPVYTDSGVSIEIRDIVDKSFPGTPLPEDDNTGYYKKITVYTAPTDIAEEFYPEPWVCGNRFTGCSVRCENDFDRAHPAGSTIDDIVYFASASPVKFIRSGYKDTFDWNHNLTSLPEEYIKTGFADYIAAGMHYEAGIRNGFHPIYGVLADIEEECFDIIGNGSCFFNMLAVLRFLEQPENTSEPLKITVTLRDDEKEYSASTEITF